MRNIFTKLLYEMEEGRDTILVTVIRKSGSAPRGAGAQMLVGASGILAGTIGGGSVENESAIHCKYLLENSCSDIHEYKLQWNSKEDIGMVCGGDMTVLFSCVSASDSLWSTAAADVLKRCSEHTAGWLLLPLSGAAASVSSEPKTEDCFPLALPVGERAVIFGGGHCALALAPLLHTVGFRVTVFDDRSDMATRERFPDAEALICGDYADLGRYLTIEEDDYIVVTTSGHSHDFEVQEQVLRCRTAYVGVIGSRHKKASVNARLREAGISDAAIASVHTPVGMSIKAVTPEEIAVSIAGEMIYERALLREQQSCL